jgi:ABC-type transport system substrate-binding protein
MWYLKILKVILILLPAVVLNGCSSSEDKPVLRLCLQTEPTTLDPIYTVDFSSGSITSLIHSNLVRFNPDGSLVPDLAEEWEISQGGREYRFLLGLSYFSNGKRITSGDVVWSFRRLLDPGSFSPRWWVLKPVLGAETYHGGGEWNNKGIEAPDDSTVVIRLAEPTAHFLSLLAMPPAAVVCSSEVERLGEDYGRVPVGSGVWMLDRWNVGESIFLHPNPQYRGKEPLIDGIFYRIIPESITRIAEFEVGNLDVLRVPRAELNRWRKGGVNLQKREELRVVYIGLNNGKEPFKNPEVRRALNMAIDVNTIIARVLFGGAVKARGVIPPPLRSFDQPPDLYPFDPDSARVLLSEAGYSQGFDMEIWQRENPEGGRVLECVQGYLSRLGIDVKLVTREWSAFKQAIDKGTPDAFYLDWFADYPDPENFITPLFHSSNMGGGGNRARYRDQRVDSLIELAAGVTNGEIREQIYQKVERMVYRDAPWIFLWFPTRFEVVSPRVKGYEIPVIFNGQQFTDIELKRD